MIGVGPGRGPEGRGPKGPGSKGRTLKGRAGDGLVDPLVCLFVFPDIIHHSGPDAMQTETGSVHAGPQCKTSGNQSFELVELFESVESFSVGGVLTGRIDHSG